MSENVEQLQKRVAELEERVEALETLVAEGPGDSLELAIRSMREPAE